MPELPEVEGFKRIVEEALVGKRIARARFLDDWMLKNTTPHTAGRRLRDRSVTSVDRRGKMLAVFTRPDKGKLEAPVLTMHFGMTGHPLVKERGTPPHHWDRLVIELERGPQLHYRNSRRLGYLKVITRSEMADTAWTFGPDALEAPVAFLRDALAGREASIKAVLLDQSLIAGVGNIYADEALYAAGIDPRRGANTLDADEIAALHKHLRRILNRAVKAQRAGGDAGFPLLRVRSRASKQLGLSGSPKVGCPRCTRPLKNVRLGGRTTFYCATCQK